MKKIYKVSGFVGVYNSTNDDFEPIETRWCDIKEFDNMGDVRKYRNTVRKKLEEFSTELCVKHGIYGNIRSDNRFIMSTDCYGGYGVIVEEKTIGWLTKVYGRIEVNLLRLR